MIASFRVNADEYRMIDISKKKGLTLNMYLFIFILVIVSTGFAAIRPKNLQ